MLLLRQMDPDLLHLKTKKILVNKEENINKLPEKRNCICIYVIIIIINVYCFLQCFQ